MPLAKVLKKHAHYKPGDVFDAHPLELRDFGDKLEPFGYFVDGGSYPKGFSASAGAQVLAERNSVDLRTVEGTGQGGMVVEADVIRYAMTRNVTVVTGDGETVLRTPDGDVAATASAIELAREHSVNLNDVTGTGQAGRILKSDVQLWLDGNAQS